MREGNRHLYPEKQEKVSKSGYVRRKLSPIPEKIEKSKSGYVRGKPSPIPGKIEKE